jgi:hypothetical protein
MTGLIDQLEAATCRHILGEMPNDPNGKLAAMALPDLLVSYGTWRSRLVLAQPRRCHLSRELEASPKAVEHKVALAAIVAKLKAGDDLSPHLSKGIDQGRGVDRMLADLGVHHLHLSTQLEANGRFVERGGDLLFAAFKPDDAYLIGFYEHMTDWARKDILETVARNWPQAGIVHELRGVIGLTQNFSDEDRLQLQRAGISSNAFEMDGKVFATLGQSLAGNPYSANQLRMVVMSVLNDWTEHLPERLQQAAQDIDEAAGRQVAGDWEAVVHEGCAGLQREDVFYGVVSLS